VERDELAERLALYDTSGERRARLAGTGDLAVDVTPLDARLELSRYDGSERTELRSGVSRAVGAGAWIVTATVPDRPTVRLPVLLARGKSRRVALAVPASIPAGYIYMPPGDALFGSSDHEELDTVPVHVVPTDGYLIAQHETTFAEWIEYLDDLDAIEREARRPKIASTDVNSRAALDLSRNADGRWRLLIKTKDRTLEASWGHPLALRTHDHGVAQDWRRMPVVAVGYDDVVAYAHWLDRTRRLEHARPCTELEWERAARGTAERRYPHGDTLQPDDANIGIRGIRPDTFGPDEVGSHRASQSPFGVDDLVGNVAELTASNMKHDEIVLRGGAFGQNAAHTPVALRLVPSLSIRALTVGFRICATFSADPATPR
jgi:eukaryotic-like serine/threonine-protein kinase